MLKIITSAPFYVWPLLAYLVFIGIKSRKTQVLPLKVLFIMPIVFTVWSFYSFTARYNSMGIGLLWALCIGVGSAIGSGIVQRMALRFDKENKLVEMPGSLLTLILSLSIFITKFGLGMAYSMNPEWIGKLLFFEFSTTIITGVFIGRLVGVLKKYKSSSHIDLRKT
ncbi:MAG TPA: DUF6622 family protein [Chlamydiales bacterium]|nr:DUF6622 family protein [Chlamydiales bacterium]